MRTLWTEDRVRIDAHHDPGPAELGIVLAHGLTGAWRRPAVRRAARVLSRTGGVVSFDFRGHGRSGGHSTVGDREVLDLAAAVGWARELGYQKVATVGFSMGAAVALRHAAGAGSAAGPAGNGSGPAGDGGDPAGDGGDLAAVVAVSGPSRWYYRDTAAMRRVHWLIEQRLGRLASRVWRRTRISPAGWDPVPEPPDAAAARIAPTPLLVVHGDADELFPVAHGYALYAAAGEPRQLWIEPGFGHAENAAEPGLLVRIGQWLSTAGTGYPSRCWLDPRVRVGTSPIEGRGLFAGAPIRAGELVAVLGGEVIDDSALARRGAIGRPYRSLTAAGGRHLLLDPEHPLGYGNHGCDPNLWLDGPTTLVARRDLPAGAELTQDYATCTGVESWRLTCRCGSTGCRGLVTGADWRRPELRRAYGDRWAPPLRDRIRQLDAAR